MKEVVFIKSFAGKKKADKGIYDGILCNTLVNTLKVAKYHKSKEVK
jgi:hypothetical protein